jgi:hypothetical protein
MTNCSGKRAAPTDVRGLIERIEVAWREFLEALDGLPDDRMHEPGAVGDWSVKDLYGHIAFWDEQAIIEFDRALAGQPERDTDWQAMNDADYALRRERTLPEQRSDMHQAHVLLLERLEGVAGIDAAPIDEAIKGASYEHYEEHIPDIKAWRERTGV